MRIAPKTNRIRVFKHASRLTIARAARAAALCLAGVGLASGASSAAGAQLSRGVVFQHGIWSNDTTWMQESANLASLYLIAPFSTSTSSKELWSTQAAQLASQVTSAGSDAILLGHSNGGLIGRLANVPTYENRSWGGLVTVGSPHGGVPLMASILDGDVGLWLSGVLEDVGDAVNYYVSVLTNQDSDDPAALYIAIADRDGVVNLAGDAFSAMGTLWLASSNPVSADMAPGSNTLANVLNAQSNLSREASAIPIRVGITSTLSSNTGVMWKGLLGENWHTAQNTADVLEAAFWAAYTAAAFYENDEDPGYQAAINGGADRWELAAVDLDGLNQDYCFFLGVGEQCGASDGIVPTTAQVYPGATVSKSISGPSHTEETRSSELDAELQNDFDNVFVIPRRPVGDVVTIIGPTSMRPENTCNWSASTNVQNASYQWQVNGQVVGTNQELSYSAGSDFTLELQVWNDSGHGGDASESISVSDGNSDCFQQRPVQRNKLPGGLKPAALRAGRAPGGRH